MPQDTENTDGLLITGFQLDKGTEPIEDCDFPRLRFVPDAMTLTLTLGGGQKITVSGSGVSAALPVLREILLGADILHKDKALTEYCSSSAQPLCPS